MYWRKVRGSRFVAGLPDQMRGRQFDCFLGFMGVGILTRTKTFTGSNFIAGGGSSGAFIIETMNENYGGYPVIDHRRFKRVKRRHSETGEKP
jgi:hypothetical protein